MQKGSPVVLREDPVVIGYLVRIILSGTAIPHKDVVYTVSDDPFEEFCEGCQENHTFIKLEEFGDLVWPIELFAEVQKPGEVNVKNFIENIEFTPI